MDGYVLALLILLVYFVILILGHKLKFWEKLHLSVYGPFLMLRTRKGRTILDKLAKPARFWNVYGQASIVICIGAMISLMVLLIWEFFLVFDLPAAAAPPPEMILGLPGINPIIPLWYGILGLAIGMVVHEFAHGIMSRVAKIKVESMGLLFLIFPMGAFVEPNEDEIKATTSKKRARLFAAGPASNVLLALFCLFLIIAVIAPSAQPVAPQGAVIENVVVNSPADKFGINRWCEILEINQTQINSEFDFDNFTFQEPGIPQEVRFLYKGVESTVILPGGVVITSTYAGLPAYNAHITPGMIIQSINNTVINTLGEFRSVVENETHSESIDIRVLSYKYDSASGIYWFYPDDNVTTITLTSKWLYYYKYYPSLNKDEYKNISYMGVTVTNFGMQGQNPDYIMNFYSQPFGNANKAEDAFSSMLRLIALPFLGFTPVESPMTNLYEPAGVLAFLPADAYWILLNSMYWIFWINLMLGLTNALPAVPLDGGYVFKDVLKDAIKKLRKTPIGLDKVTSTRKPMSDEQLDRAIGMIAILVSLIVLFLILWQIIGPRLPL